MFRGVGCLVLPVDGWLLGYSVSQSVSQSISQSGSQSINQSIIQSVNQSVSQSINQSIRQSINQSTNQSVNQSVSYFVILTNYRPQSKECRATAMLKFSKKETKTKLKLLRVTKFTHQPTNALNKIQVMTNINLLC